MSRKQQTLRQRYDDYWERCKDLPTLEYKTPCCGEMQKTRKPDGDETWDTLSECVHCNSMFWMVATAKGVTTIIPPARSAN